MKNRMQLVRDDGALGKRCKCCREYATGWRERVARAGR